MLPALLGAIGRGVAVNAMTKPDKHVDAPDKQRLAESFPKFGISSPSFKPSNITNASSLPTTAVNDNSITSKTADGIFKSVLNVLTRIEQSMKQQVQLAIADNKANREMMLEKGDDANAFGKSGEDTGIRNATDEMGLLGTALAAGVLGVIAFKDEIAEGVKTMKSLWEWVSNRGNEHRTQEQIAVGQEAASGIDDILTGGKKVGDPIFVGGPRGSTKGGRTPQQKIDLSGKYSGTKIGGMLSSIRWAEGTAGADGYGTRFGGGKFTPGKGHPGGTVTANGYTSSAAGAYQFLGDTWKNTASTLGLKDFSKTSQDKAAVYLAMQRLNNKGIKVNSEADLERLLAKEGMSPRILHALAGEWASLPNHNNRSQYGQPVKKRGDLNAVFYNNAAGATPTALSKSTIQPAQSAVPVKRPTHRGDTVTKPLVKFNSSLKPATASIPSRRATKTAMASPTVIAPTIVQGNQGTAGRGSGGVPAPGKTPTTLSYQQYFRV